MEKRDFGLECTLSTLAVGWRLAGGSGGSLAVRWRLAGGSAGLVDRQIEESRSI